MSGLELNVSKQSFNSISIRPDFPILAIDYGERRMGLAISDSKGIIATPLDVIKIPQGKGFKSILPQLITIIEQNRVKTILVGVPQVFTSNHIKTKEKIEIFIGFLKKSLKYPLLTTDESFSTADAQNMLLSSGQHTKATKDKIDKGAAAVFLQNFLNSLTKTNYEI